MPREREVVYFADRRVHITDHAARFYWRRYATADIRYATVTRISRGPLEGPDFVRIGGVLCLSGIVALIGFLFHLPENTPIGAASIGPLLALLPLGLGLMIYGATRRDRYTVVLGIAQEDEVQEIRVLNSPDRIYSDSVALAVSRAVGSMASSRTSPSSR